MACIFEANYCTDAILQLSKSLKVFVTMLNYYRLPDTGIRQFSEINAFVYLHSNNIEFTATMPIDGYKETVVGLPETMHALFSTDGQRFPTGQAISRKCNHCRNDCEQYIGCSLKQVLICIFLVLRLFAKISNIPPTAPSQSKVDVIML